MIRLVILLLAVCFSISNTQAQDLHFSQFYHTAMYLNPARCASDADLRVVLINRSQWQSLATPYRTTGLSIETKFKNPEGARKPYSFTGGVYGYTDKAGTNNLKTLVGGVTIGMLYKLDRRNQLSFGITNAIRQRSFGNNDFQWGRQFDGEAYNSNLASGESSSLFVQKVSYDLSVGANYFYKKGNRYMSSNDYKMFNVGLAIYNINRANQSLSSLQDPTKIRAVLNAEAFMGFSNTNVSLRPMGYIQLQGKHREIVIGMPLSYRMRISSVYTSNRKSYDLSFGPLLRLQDALVLMTQVDFSNWAVGVSYDVNVSKLSAYTNSKGAYELSLRFMTPNSLQRKSKLRI